MSVNTCNIASFAAAVSVTYACAHAYIHMHTQAQQPHCQSKLGACSLNPIYGSPIVFLDAVSDTGMKGQNSSTHHPGREKINKCLKTERGTGGRTGQRRQEGWNRLAGIRKTQMIVSQSERGRRWDKHMGRRRDRLHAMNSAVTPPNLPRLSFLSLTGDDRPHPVSVSVTSITQGPDTVITVWAPYQTSTLLRVCISLCVPDWVCDPLLQKKRKWEYARLCVCNLTSKPSWEKSFWLLVYLTSSHSEDSLWIRLGQQIHPS